MTSAVVLIRGAVATSTPKAKLPVKRALFGCNSPSAKKLNDNFCQKRLKEIIDKKSKEWEFDFCNGVPMPSSSSANTTFTYQQISADLIPPFYRLSRLQNPTNATLCSSTTPILSPSENVYSCSTNDMDSDNENCSYESCFGYSRHIQNQQNKTPKKHRQASLNDFVVSRRRKSITKKVITGTPRRSIRQLAPTSR